MPTKPIAPNDFWADESWGEVPDGFSSNCELSIPFGNCQKVSTDRWLYASRWFAFPGTGKGTGVPKAQYGDVTQWLDLSGLYGNPMKPQKLFGSLEMFPWVEVSPTGEILNDGKLISEKNAWDLSYVFCAFIAHVATGGFFKSTYSILTSRLLLISVSTRLLA